MSIATCRTKNSLMWHIIIPRIVQCSSDTGMTFIRLVSTIFLNELLALTKKNDISCYSSQEFVLWHLPIEILTVLPGHYQFACIKKYIKRSQKYVFSRMCYPRTKTMPSLNQPITCHFSYSSCLRCLTITPVKKFSFNNYDSYSIKFINENEAFIWYFFPSIWVNGWKLVIFPNFISIELYIIKHEIETNNYTLGIIIFYLDLRGQLVAINYVISINNLFFLTNSISTPYCGFYWLAKKNYCCYISFSLLLFHNCFGMSKSVCLTITHSICNLFHAQSHNTTTESMLHTRIGRNWCIYNSSRPHFKLCYL